MVENLRRQPALRQANRPPGAFSEAGAVESVNVMRDMATGRARGFAFVEMATDEDAQNAISKFNETSWRRNLNVNEARPAAGRRRLRRGRRRQLSPVGTLLVNRR
jgi:RNA recognition motif-containing protein